MRQSEAADRRCAANGALSYDVGVDQRAGADWSLRASTGASLGAQPGEAETLGQAATEHGEAGVLSLSGLFASLVGKRVNASLAYCHDKLVTERSLFRAEFRGVADRLEEQKTEVERFARAIEETRRRVDGRDSLKDLTEHESWITTTAAGDVHCSICTKFADTVKGTLTGKSLRSPWIQRSVGYNANAVNLFNKRVGSHMQLVNTKLRTSLHDSTFAALVFLSFNLPHLHEIDFDVLIAAWKKAGHRLPINKNDAESRVLRRLKSASTSTYFLNMGSPFLPTDFDFLKNNKLFAQSAAAAADDDDDHDDE